jgi:hypothetical protein
VPASGPVKVASPWPYSRPSPCGAGVDGLHQAVPPADIAQMVKPHVTLPSAVLDRLRMTILAPGREHQASSSPAAPGGGRSPAAKEQAQTGAEPRRARGICSLVADPRGYTPKRRPTLPM